jgi:DNA invertase Pin-like site-specific DNA recombinase
VLRFSEAQAGRLHKRSGLLGTSASSQGVTVASVAQFESSSGSAVQNNVTKYLAAIGRKGGQSRSKAKAKAARANGKKGGRPRTTSKTPSKTPSKNSA